MNLQSVQSLLNYGAAGLAALVLVACYWILKAEQARKGEPRRGIIGMFIFFCAFGLLLFGGALWSEHFAGGRKSDQLRVQLEETRTELARIGNLREEQERAASGLRQELAERYRAYEAAEERAALLARQLSESKQHIEELRGHVSALELEGANTVQRLASMTRQSEALDEQLVRLTGELSATNNRASALEEREQELAEELRRYTQERYFNQGTVSLGGTYVDPLTGATISISEMRQTFNDMSGALTYPNGTIVRILARDIGTAWRYTWNGRTFLITAGRSPTTKGSFVAVIREVTEHAPAKTQAALP